MNFKTKLINILHKGKCKMENFTKVLEYFETRTQVEFLELKQMIIDIKNHHHHNSNKTS